MLQKLKELIFPSRCVSCDEVMYTWEKGICRYCLPKLKYISNPFCLKCGKQLIEEEREICRDCEHKTHNFISGRALYEYEEIAASIYRYKYQGRREYAAFFAEEIVFHLGDFIRCIQPDAFVPVPMYAKKERLRGYNQAKLLSDELSKRFHVPTLNNYVIRRKNTKPLKNLNPNARANNLKKAFILKENSVKLNTIIIIDDIYTTGSTIDVIADCILEKYNMKIYFITLSIGAGV